MTTKRFDFYDIIQWLLYLVIVIMIMIGIYFGCRVYIVDQFVIPTSSMEPTLIPGDRIIVNKLITGARIYDDFDFSEGVPMKSHRAWGLRKIKHNDIVIFNFPINDKDGKMEFKLNYVYGKRCIGIPGDSVYVEDGFFYTNTYDGELGDMEQQRILSSMPDTYVDRPYDPHNYGWTAKNWGPIYVPKCGDSIVLDSYNYPFLRRVVEFESGENLRFNADGTLMLGDKPTGKYVFTKNYYFMCGDNVVNSHDSRYWGFVPEEFIIGVVSHITYSKDRESGGFRWNRLFKSVID